MKQLLTLTSFLLVFFIDAKNITYEIQEGDTLFSIAKNNNISINEIYLANTALGLSADYILQGNFIKIPEPMNYEYQDKCFTRLGATQMHTEMSMKEVTSQCLKLFENKNINAEILSKEDILFNINKILFEYGFDADENAKYSKPIVSAALNGNISAAYASVFFDSINFENLILNKKYAIIADQNIQANEKFDECKKLLINQDIDDYDLLIYFYLECSDSYFDFKDNEYIKFDNKLIDLILSNDTKIVKMFELYAVSIISYHMRLVDDSEAALDFTRTYVRSRCSDCIDSIDLFNKYVDIRNDGYSSYLLYALYYFVLNDTSVFYDVRGVVPDELIEERQDFLNRISNDLKKNPDYDYILTPYADYLADTAMKLLSWRECDKSRIYLDKALSIYSQDIYDNTNELYFTQPLFLSACYLIESSYSDFTNKILLEKAKQYRDIAKDVKIQLNVSSPIKISLYNLIDAYIEKIEKNYQNSYDILTNISIALKDPKNYYFVGDLDNFELISSIYIDIFVEFNEDKYAQSQIKDFDINTLIDPIELVQIKDFFARNIKLVNLKIASTNKDLKDTQDRLKLNNLKIRQLETEGSNFNQMLDIYTENKDLTEKILNDNKNIELLTSSPRNTISSISSSLNDKEYAYFLLNSPILSKIILINHSNQIYSYSIPSKEVMSVALREMKKSINPNKSYDFDLAKFLGETYFPFINGAAKNKISKESTIYLYTDNFIGIPPGILVKSYNSNPSISEYERLITAEWFIKDYNFSTRLNFNNFTKTENYERQFLGLGNSTTYKWLGLPNLTEVNSEITELALSSFGLKEDILKNKSATKEALLNKFNKSYKRIVIATHAVPPNWKGFINEPSLVLNSRYGDYFLSPSEIISTNIDSEMVVLSSCNASTKGFDDLYKSFLIAGADSVVHSNWNLDSKYAKEFTTTFFKELWLNEDLKHIAIRNVSKDFINDYSNQIYAHPAYWGNFSIVYSN
jgi:CHAT domain-containing protein/LysM repeat protein|tara:strand:+ start:402 stop:3332 length:2931 start_codon:yes stop_codon:yes gene_type:complete